VLDNLYMYGDTAHMNEATPMAPVSKKGALRLQAAECMLQADARGALPVAIGRAPDFFGPEAALSSVILGDRFFRRVFAGKTAQVFGDPDQPHAYAYTPDVAAGLVALGASDARGVWMLPAQPAETTRAVIARFASALDRPIGIATVPTWALRGAGVFAPLLREVAEMTYQWKAPFVVDDSRFQKAFGFGPTRWDEAVATTVAWARGVYDAPRALTPATRLGASPS
jgi:nucleoside-diphosphate-sugar epimerase